jgi:hypothetical protein
VQNLFIKISSSTTDANIRRVFGAMSNISDYVSIQQLSAFFVLSNEMNHNSNRISFISTVCRYTDCSMCFGTNPALRQDQGRNVPVQYKVLIFIIPPGVLVMIIIAKI